MGDSGSSMGKWGKGLTGRDSSRTPPRGKRKNDSNPEPQSAFRCRAGGALLESRAMETTKPFDPGVAERQPVWPAGAMPDRQPHQIAAMTDEADAPEFDFDAATPPILFVHGDADGWAAMNSVKAWEQLRRIGVQGEVHTLATRQHCFQSSASPDTGSYTYLDRLWEFLSAKHLLE